MRIFIYGGYTERNLGVPLLLHGAQTLLEKLYGEDVETVYYQMTPVEECAVRDIKTKVRQIPATFQSPAHLIRAAVLEKLGMGAKVEEEQAFLKELRSADVVMNIYGICFCSKLNPRKNGALKSKKVAIGSFYANAVAKWFFAKKSVKAPASFGPINTADTIRQAKFAARHIFDNIGTREVESYEAIRPYVREGHLIEACPDIANLAASLPPVNREKTIGISISHQISRQWAAEDAYLDCIEQVIKHILTNLGHRVLLIPNENTKGNSYTDIHVARDIMARFPGEERVEVLSIEKMSALEIKREIAACDILLSSRYHSCVAALSSGVPVLVLGWHYKYTELLRWYGQDEWYLTNENCTAQSLCEKLDALYRVRNKEKEMIQERKAKVEEAVIRAGEALLKG